MKIIKIALTIIYSFSILGLLGQTIGDTISTDSIKGLEVDKVQVVKAFEATLKAAKHTDVKPVLPTLTRTEKRYNYNITIAPLDLEYPDPEIRPLAMKADPSFPIKKGYVKAGYGNIMNPQLRIGYHDSVEDSHNFGVSANYYGADQSYKLSNWKMSTLNLGLTGGVIVKDNMQLDLAISGNNEKRYFYHKEVIQDSLPTDNDPLRDINNIAVLLGVKNVYESNSNVNYNANIGFDYSKITNNDANGISVFTSFEVVKRFSKKIGFSLYGKVAFDKQSSDIDSDLLTISGTPVFEFNSSRTNIKIGADFIKDDNVSKIFPHADIAIGLVGNNIQLVAGSFMTPYSYNLKNMSTMNPWIDANIDTLSNNIRSEIYAGVRGEWSFVSYEGKIGYRKNTNQKYLNNVQSDIRYFEMIDDELNTKFITGNIDFAFSEEISIGGKLSVNIFDSENYEEAIQLPTTHLGVYSFIRLLNEKLILQPAFYFTDAPYYQSREGQLIKLNRQAELNFAASYNLSNSFGIWIEGTNLLDKEYQRWAGYPNFGIHFGGGVHFIF